MSKIIKGDRFEFNGMPCIAVGVDVSMEGKTYEEAYAEAKAIAQGYAQGVMDEMRRQAEEHCPEEDYSEEDPDDEYSEYDCELEKKNAVIRDLVARLEEAKQAVTRAINKSYALKDNEEKLKKLGISEDTQLSLEIEIEEAEQEVQKAQQVIVDLHKQLEEAERDQQAYIAEHKDECEEE